MYIFYHDRNIKSSYLKDVILVCKDLKIQFQSTFPRGERPTWIFILSILLLFQSTFPRGERLRFPFIYGSFICFNPRSHEGNDEIVRFKGFQVEVSIHVPTRGTTGFRGIRRGSDGFQSTFPRGERQVLAFMIEG